MNKALNKKIKKASYRVTEASLSIHNMMDKIPAYRIGESDRYDALKAAVDCLYEARKQIDLSLEYVEDLPRR